MLKPALLLAVGMTTGFVAAGRLVYSALQIQVPSGTAFKMTPDPSNIWSFHQQVSVSGSTVLPVVIDMDNDNKMDTHNKLLRVLITDMQVSMSGLHKEITAIQLVDQAGARWDLRPRGELDGRNQIASSTRGSYHLTTPLALPVGSDLKVAIQRSGPGTATVSIHLIGRVVTL